MEKGKHNTYATFEEYIQRQSEKSSDPKRREKWLGEEWGVKLKGFEEIFAAHTDILSGAKNALMLGARTGQEVVALRNMGIDAIGLDLVPHEPLVVKGDFHNIPFPENHFDFVFTNCFDHSLHPEKMFAEVFRVLKVGGHFLLHVQVGIDSDEYTETSVADAFEVVGYSGDLSLKSSQSIKRNFANMNHEIVFVKKEARAPFEGLLSIVIPTYNRSSVVCELISSLKNQTDKNFEVVVVSDGSPDNTIEAVKALSHTLPFPVSVFDTGLTKEYGLATARNLGISHAKGEVVAILDDDSFPMLDYVRAHKMSVKEHVLTGGPRTASVEDPKMQEKNQLYFETYGDCTPSAIVPIPKYKWIVENNTCMFKKDWVASGLFDESIKMYGGIGQKFNEEIMKRGFSYQFNPRAVIVHKTEYRQNHLYARIKPQKIKAFVANTLKKRTPKLYEVARSAYKKLRK